MLHSLFFIFHSCQKRVALLLCVCLADCLMELLIE